MARERMYNLVFLNIEQDIVPKMDFTDIIDFIHSCKNQEKTVLSVLTCNFGFVLIYFCRPTKNSSAVSSIWKKIFLFQFFATFAFSKVIHKAKVSSRDRGPLIYQVRQGPCGLNPAPLGGFPQVSNSPIASPLPCSEDHYLIATFRL